MPEPPVAERVTSSCVKGARLFLLVGEILKVTGAWFALPTVIATGVTVDVAR